ncbi:MAG: type II secretion system protein, partial [Candidatus Colwellbacteria bacterium]|nr:type II secretion system protein [Candidatus Colwellbacteria bacterium]
MSRGFTLIELLIVTAITLILAAVVFSNYAGIREKKILDVEADKVVSIIREVMERSKSQAEGNQWGVHFENPVGEGADFYEIWNGASYPGSGTTTRYYLADYLGFQTP